MKEIKKQLYLRWDELLLILAVQAVLFLFGEILLAVVIKLSGEQEGFEMGTLMALMTPLGMLIFFGMSAFTICFNQAVGMCTTRRRFLPAFAVISWLESIGLMALVYVYNALEHLILRAMNLTVAADNSLAVIFQWKYLFAASFAVLAIQIFFGALLQKYGKTAFWILWGIWMIVFLGGPRLQGLLASYADTAVVRALSDLASHITGGVLWAVEAVVCIAMLLAGYLMLRRQQVNQ